MSGRLQSNGMVGERSLRLSDTTSEKTSPIEEEGAVLSAGGGAVGGRARSGTHSQAYQPSRTYGTISAY